MKIMTCCSKKFYHAIPAIKEELEKAGHEVVLPNCYENPGIEQQIKESDPEKHMGWKAEMLHQQKDKVLSADAILILNLPHGDIPGHIGGATFLEAYEAWQGKKKVYLLTPHVPAILKDEFAGFGAVCINGDISEIA